MSSFTISRLLRYSFVGGATAGIYLSLYYTFKYTFHLSDFVSNIFAYSLAVFFQYKYQSNYTFHDVSGSDFRWLKFLVTCSTGYIFSLYVTSYLVPAGYVGELIGSLLVVFLLPLFNLIVMFIWVFSAAKH